GHRSQLSQHRLILDCAKSIIGARAMAEKDRCDCNLVNIEVSYLDRGHADAFVSTFSFASGTMRIARVVTAGMLLTAGLASPASAQKRICKSVDLRRIGPTGYTSRGTRCEGILEREVGGDVISVVGLSHYIEDFDPQLGIDLRVTWGPLSSD